MQDGTEQDTVYLWTRSALRVGAKTGRRQTWGTMRYSANAPTTFCLRFVSCVAWSKDSDILHVL